MTDFNFKSFALAVKNQLQRMSQNGNPLFLVATEHNELWDKYLDAFPPGTNPIFRERTHHDCSCCRHFIRDVGAVVAIRDDYSLSTIWDVEVEEPYQTVADVLARHVRSKSITDQFLTSTQTLGTEYNHEQMADHIHRWDHFHATVPTHLVKPKDQIPTLKGRARENAQVLYRSITEISFDACETVLELIDQNSLYRGQEHRHIVAKLLDFKHQAANADPGVWLWSAQLGEVSKIRNTVIGTLLVDLSEGVSLDGAIKSFESKVAPANYKRTSAPVTKTMIKRAEEKVAELGLTESLPRRFAMLEDITANDILFANRSTAKVLDPTGNAFANLAASVPDKPQDLSRLEEIRIDEFITNVLPKAQSIEALFENRHQSNLVSLIAPANADAEPLLKWGNNFSWSYNGDVTDSMKERVKRAGGRVDGVLRFSIMWNDDLNQPNLNDFDAHCKEPSGYHIHYPHARKRFPSSGMLDVDIIDPQGVAVENIIWTKKRQMPKGFYRMSVHCYSNRGGTDGFSAEIEFGGKIYNFAWKQRAHTGQTIRVADVEHLGDGKFKITEHLTSQSASQPIWNIATEKFQPVSVVMRSPNHWDGRKTGNEHVFFIIESCKKPDPVRGLYNEFLRTDLTEHRKVFEVLGNMMKAPYSDNQLSGLGFSTTKRDNVVVKVRGAFNRTLRINF